MTRRNTPRISFIGFGEAGQAIASGLRETGIERVAAWDILFPERTGTQLKEAAESLGVRVASSARDAARETDGTISAVTAASSVDAARSVASDLSGNPYYLDINSVSPGRKQETAKLLGECARSSMSPSLRQSTLLDTGRRYCYPVRTPRAFHLCYMKWTCNSRSSVQRSDRQPRSR